jgi:DNA mismatch repair protein MutL
VVKELVENAIDAGSTRIATTIEDGGRQLIRVADDGWGMNPDELRLAVLPHATSKLTSDDDLFHIATLGFRGEALASVSAVSKLRIVSRSKDAIEAREIQVVADEAQTTRASGANLGTTVEVRDLFFNVPARRKFLRTPSTEVGHINEQIARLALAHAHIAFELTNNTRVTQNLPVCQTRLERIARFYGPELAAALLHVSRNERGIRLDAYLAPPAQSRATAQWQYTFLNGRYIRDKYLQHAIKEAYRGLMEPNRHGVAFVFIELDPAEFDVNVHPTKIEVRWANANLVHSTVLSAMRETFQRCDLAPALRTGRAREAVDPAEQERVRRELAEAFKSTSPIRPSEFASVPAAYAARPAGAPARRPSAGDLLNPMDAWETLYGDRTGSTAPPSGGDIPESLEPGGPEGDPNTEFRIESSDTGGNWPSEIGNRQSPSRAVQMHNLYLVAETDEGIVIVDQHALHERVMYEQFRRRVTRGPLESQRLLLPESIRVTPRQLDLLEANADLLATLGIEVTPFGTDSVAVHAFPSRLKDTDVPGFMRDLLDKLAEKSAPTEADEVLDDLLAMMACKAAVKAGDPLSAEEIHVLMQQRHLLDTPSACPHGRPTTLRLTKADLNRQFHRT